MPRLASLRFLLVATITHALVGTGALRSQSIDDYNVVWTTPSASSADSMPVGGGDVGLNVWVEDGDLLFYVARSDAFDENNALLKLGRVRVRLGHAPWRGPEFRQELRLREGRLTLSGGGGTTVNLWVDAFRPVVHLTITTAQPSELLAAYETWRHLDRPIAGREFEMMSFGAKIGREVFTTRDQVAFHGGEVRFHHRNPGDRDDAFDVTVQREGLAAVKDQLFDPVGHRTFGGVLAGSGLVAAGTSTGTYAGTPFQAWQLRSAAPAITHQLQLVLHTAQTETLAAWEAGLARTRAEAQAAAATAEAETRAWWAQFWERSYIHFERDDPVRWQLGRNYQLFRYQLGCNARGEFPTKFNGGLFTFDPGHVNPALAFTPDFRRWRGGVMTAQNQRLVYFPLLKSGDFDLLEPQFRFYLRAQRNAELRTQVHWGHAGASFAEQLESFGLPNMVEYGQSRAADYNPGVDYNPWLEYQWDTVFEFCLMMLEAERYAGRDLSDCLPFIQSCVTFYDEHYRHLARRRGIRELNERGHLILYPGTALETYKGAYNPTPTIAALQVILTRLLELPPRYGDAAARARWQTLLARVPPLPLTMIDGHRTIAPALVWERIQNSETPQLYPVFPWGLYGIGQPDLDVARATYLHDPHAVQHRSHEGWRQSSIFAARLGLTAEAARLTQLKLADNPRHRFPTFWGPAFDWTPDHNWGGSAMIGLQEMLLQAVGEKIYLLPAWPKGWNARFKLHAPYQTVVEATVRDGTVVELRVTPASRAADVIVLPSSE